VEVGIVGNDYMEAIKKLLEDEKRNDSIREMKKGKVEVQETSKQKIRRLIENDIRSDIDIEIRQAADELLMVRREAIKEVVEEQRKAVKEIVKEEKKAVWTRLDDIRDSISNYGETS
jgi:hypothetical protein